MSHTRWQWHWKLVYSAKLGYPLPVPIMSFIKRHKRIIISAAVGFLIGGVGSKILGACGDT